MSFLSHHKESFKDCLIVCNPNRRPSEVKRLKKILSYVTLDTNFVFKENPIITQDGEHLERIVEKFYQKSHFNNVILFGGDGTVHTAINFGMKNLHNGKSMGFFRGGSGNGIQDSYEIPFRLHEQVLAFAESLANNYSIDVDILKVSYLTEDGPKDIFCQLAGFGIDATLLKRRESHKYSFGPRKGSTKSGFPNYIYSGLETFLFDYGTQEFDISMREGKYAPRGTRSNVEIPFSGNDVMVRTVSAPMIEIGTRAYYGKMFKICPDVVCNNGNMDLYIFDFENKFQMLRNFVDLYTGEHGKVNRRYTNQKKPPIERYEILNATISSEQPFAFHVDGDLKECHIADSHKYSVEINVIPKAMNFLVPRSFYNLAHPFS